MSYEFPDNIAESVWTSAVGFAEARIESESDRTTDWGVRWAARRIDALEERLAIDTLNPNRREHINKLITQNQTLQEQVETLNDHILQLNEKLASNRQTMVDLQTQVEDLKEDVMQEKYEHWKTCDGEGLEWHGPVPEKLEPFFGEKLP